MLADEADLYREMGWDGPLYGSVLWKLRRVLERGVMYDWHDFHKHMAWFSKGYTFKEAFEKTGRVLNISCTPLRSRGARNYAGTRIQR